MKPVSEFVSQFGSPPFDAFSGERQIEDEEDHGQLVYSGQVRHLPNHLAIDMLPDFSIRRSKFGAKYKL